MKWVLAAILFSVSPAFGQTENVTIPSVTANPDVLYGCLASGKAAAQCLDAMTQDCRAENALGNENLKERLCVVEELNIWRGLHAKEHAALADRLNNLTDEQRSTYFAAPAPFAAVAQSTWDEWQGRQCKMERAVMGNHSRRAIIEDTCTRDLVALQFGRLRNINRQLGIK
jgi:hypothetical protein